METWETLKRAIPDGESKAVAKRMHHHPDHVRRWRREPLSVDAPLSTGQRSPLDRCCDLLDAIFLSNPIGAALVAEHVWGHYTKLRDALNPKTQWDKRAHAANTLREAVEAVNCLNLDVDDEQTIIEIVEARDALDKALVNLRAVRPQSGPREIHEERRVS